MKVTRGPGFPLLLAFCLLLSGGRGERAGVKAGTASGTTQGSGSLAPAERAIVQAVDSRNDEALALLEKVVNINSGTLNPAGVREVGAVFRNELDSLGFVTRWEEGEAFHRAGHLWAEREGGHGPRFLLIGHLDTVFEPDSPFQRFRRLEGEKASGPGVIDMKGGDVILVQALRALAAAGELDGMRITVVLTGDEERSGEPLEISRRSLLAAAEHADIALGFEDGDGKADHAVIARRGSSAWVLRLTGSPAHSSQIFTPEVGAGAIFEAARILDLFRRRMSGEPYLTFSPGVILGGTDVDLEESRSGGTAFGKSNVVAGRAVVEGDLRTVSPRQLEKARSEMRAIVARNLPRTGAEIVFKDSYPPMAPSEGNRKLLRLYDRVSRDLGFGSVTATDPRDAGAADISFTAAKVGMALDALGLKGTGGHTVDETADLKVLPLQAKRAAVLLHRLAQEGNGR